MKKLIFVLISAVTVLTAHAQCGTPPPGTQVVNCPEAPEGFCPYVEAFALTSVYTIQEPSRIYFPPAAAGGFLTTGIRLEFVQASGSEYEIQFCRSLSEPIQWIAYGRWAATRTAIVLTDCPIYPCDPQRFFRVMSKPLVVPVQAAQRQRVFHSSLVTSKVNSRYRHHTHSNEN